MSHFLFPGGGRPPVKAPPPRRRTLRCCVAFRRPRPQHEYWANRFSAWRHSNPEAEVNFCHVEITLESECADPGQCPRCKALHAHQAVHRHTYRITTLPGEDTVKEHIDRRAYESPEEGVEDDTSALALWVFYVAELDIQTVTLMHAFLRRQEGVPVNQRRLWLNFLPGLERCVARGCPVLTDQNVKFYSGAAHGWFCSELVAAALQIANVLPDTPPHRVSPNRLALALQEQVRFTVTHRDPL